MEPKLLSLLHCTQINVPYKCSVEAQLPPFPRYALISHCTSLFPLLSSDFHSNAWESDSDPLLWPILWSYGKRDFSKYLWHFISCRPRHCHIHISFMLPRFILACSIVYTPLQHVLCILACLLNIYIKTQIDEWQQWIEPSAHKQNMDLEGSVLYWEGAVEEVMNLIWR